jgi:hypothetical protein
MLRRNKHDSRAAMGSRHPFRESGRFAAHDDTAMLDRIVDLARANPELTPRAVILAAGITREADIRRLRDKLRHAGTKVACAAAPRPVTTDGTADVAAEKNPPRALDKPSRAAALARPVEPARTSPTVSALLPPSQTTVAVAPTPPPPQQQQTAVAPAPMRPEPAAAPAAAVAAPANPATALPPAAPPQKPPASNPLLRAGLDAITSSVRIQAELMESALQVPAVAMALKQQAMVLNFWLGFMGGNPLLKPPKTPDKT